MFADYQLRPFCYELLIVREIGLIGFVLPFPFAVFRSLTSALDVELLRLGSAALSAADLEKIWYVVVHRSEPESVLGCVLRHLESS